MFDERKSGRWPRVSHGLGRLLLVAAALIAQAAVGQPQGIAPEARALLETSTRYLAGQGRFSVRADSTIEVVLHTGQKIQFDHAATMAVARPNRLRAERVGDLVEQVFYYDGESLTLHNPGDDYYATVAAPDTLEGMLDFARESLDIVAPAGDLVYANAYDILMQDVTSGFVVGRSTVDGVVCTHLAFRTPHADWQIWVQDGSSPLPRKLVITSTDVPNAPQFTIVMSDWDLAPVFDAQTFIFQPPVDARRIDFLPATNSTGPGR
jgi:hypothetical protein